MSDLDKAPDWITGLERTELVEGKPGQANSSVRYYFSENGKIVEFFERVISVIPEKKFASDLENKVLRMRSITDFSALNADETDVQIHNEVRGKGFWMRLFLPLMKGMMKKRQQGDLANLKARLEG
jgi:hypothetical protein